MNEINNKSLILNRIKFAENLKTDTELAEFLGVMKATVSNWHRRNTIDYDIIIQKCSHLDLEWLITGKERTNTNEGNQAVSEPLPKYISTSKCSNCIINESIIIEKNKQIELQSKLIGRLEELLKVKKKK